MTPFGAALHALAQRRLTQAQLWKKLERKGFDDTTIRDVIARCLADGLLDDQLFARLFIESVRKPVGNARLVGQLVSRGIDPQVASDSVGMHEVSEHDRCTAASLRAVKRNPNVSYACLARSLERCGFPASIIYRVLREHAREHGPMSSLGSDGDYMQRDYSNDSGG